MSIYQNIPSEYHVGRIRIAPNIVLAPMVGVTDSIFRRMILSLGGCGLVSSEMTNAASVSPRARSRHNQLEFLPEERPITMQLSGNEPDLVAQAAKTVELLGADILDINCGCPSPKVTGGGHGSALLKDLCKMEALIKAGADVNVRLTKHLWYMSYNFDQLSVSTAGATPFWRFTVSKSRSTVPVTTISTLVPASATTPFGAAHGVSQGLRMELRVQPFGNGPGGISPPVAQCT
jgi:hypothetical protein